MPPNPSGMGAGPRPGRPKRTLSALVRQMEWEQTISYAPNPAEKALRLRMLDSVVGRHAETVAVGAGVLGSVLAKPMGSIGRVLYGGVIGTWIYNVMLVEGHPDPAYRYVEEVARLPNSTLAEMNREMLTRNLVTAEVAPKLPPKDLLLQLLTPPYLSYLKLPEPAGQPSEGGLHLLSMHLRSNIFSVGYLPATHGCYVAQSRRSSPELYLVHHNRDLLASHTSGLAWLWWQLYLAQNASALADIAKKQAPFARDGAGPKPPKAGGE
eukprot:TRINITY_DN6711_c1_g1_i1.p1 TRINITY_DN6711_c1_g1~~TRINITY_DN6711_c1_g1_i1.p1  ORF type:complete len:267 (+),score=88.45 TRINITY_DN6711_c1_g1_i1:73-873(+)